MARKNLKLGLTPWTIFATPDQFEEKLETHLRAVIRERFPDNPVVEPRALSWYRGSPFRRLEVFEFEPATKSVGD
jgi:hypothetical protein